MQTKEISQSMYSYLCIHNFSNHSNFQYKGKINVKPVLGDHLWEFQSGLSRFKHFSCTKRIKMRVNFLLRDISYADTSSSETSCHSFKWYVRSGLDNDFEDTLNPKSPVTHAGFLSYWICYQRAQCI